MDYNLTLFKDSVKDLLLAPQINNNDNITNSSSVNANNSNLISNNIINNSGSQET